MLLNGITYIFGIDTIKTIKNLFGQKDETSNNVVDEKDKLTLRIKRDGENYLIKGTNVMFDMTTQTIIGYKKDGSYILEENDETKEACASYKLKFK